MGGAITVLRWIYIGLFVPKLFNFKILQDSKLWEWPVFFINMSGSPVVFVRFLGISEVFNILSRESIQTYNDSLLSTNPPKRPQLLPGLSLVEGELVTLFQLLMFSWSSLNPNNIGLLWESTGYATILSIALGF